MIYYPEMSLTEPVETAVEIKEIQPQPWWTKEITKRSVETVQEEICDHYCKMVFIDIEVIIEVITDTFGRCNKGP